MAGTRRGGWSVSLPEVTLPLEREGPAFPRRLSPPGRVARGEGSVRNRLLGVFRDPYSDGAAARTHTDAGDVEDAGFLGDVEGGGGVGGGKASADTAENTETAAACPRAPSEPETSQRKGAEETRRKCRGVGDGNGR